MSLGVFSVVQQAVMAKVKDQATSARDRFQAVTEKVMQEVVESDAFKKHVAFNFEDHAQPDPNFQRENSGSSKDNTSEIVSQDEPIGFVSVFVSRVAGLKSSATQVYIEVEVEGITKRTPISEEVKPYDFDRKMFDWEESVHQLHFAVSDVKSNVAVRVLVENVLSTDQLVGQVIIPLARVIPSMFPNEYHEQSMLIAMQADQGRFKEGPLVYELYPLPRNRSEFQPAVKDSAKTGMDKPIATLGYARIRTEFVPKPAPTWLARAYLLSQPYMKRPKRASLKNVNLDVARTQRHVKRQLKRLEAIFERIVFGPLPLTLPFSYARSWDSRLFSSLFTFFTAFCILYLPAFLSPLYLFVTLCIGGYLARQQGEPDPVVWNEDIRDPDDALNPMQRIAKLLWVLETISTTLVEYADFFERFIHAFGFRDERASVLLFICAFVSMCGLCMFCFFVSFRMFLFAMFCTWLFLPVDYYSRYQRFIFLVKSGKKIPWHPIFQPMVNLLSRVPTTEQLGHERICNNQIVKNQAIIQKVERISGIEHLVTS